MRLRIYKYHSQNNVYIITSVLEKQASLLEQIILHEQTISPLPTYHVIYHDLYLISKCGVNFKTFIERRQTKPYPLYIQK
jgi:hypothetical protein